MQYNYRQVTVPYSDFEKVINTYGTMGYRLVEHCTYGYGNEVRILMEKQIKESTD